MVRNDNSTVCGRANEQANIKRMWLFNSSVRIRVFFMNNRRVLFSSLFLNGKLLKSLFLSTNLLQLNIFFYL